MLNRWLGTVLFLLVFLSSSRVSLASNIDRCKTIEQLMAAQQLLGQNDFPTCGPTCVANAARILQQEINRAPFERELHSILQDQMKASVKKGLSVYLGSHDDTLHRFTANLLKFVGIKATLRSYTTDDGIESMPRGMKYSRRLDLDKISLNEEKGEIGLLSVELEDSGHFVLLVSTERLPDSVDKSGNSSIQNLRVKFIDPQNENQLVTGTISIRSAGSVKGTPRLTVGAGTNFTTNIAEVGSVNVSSVIIIEPIKE